MLPESVLKKAQAELMNYRGSGMSVMEMSHRSAVYADIFAETKARFQAALSVPDSHEILFLQGGASTQFSMVPLNLLPVGGSADYAVTGHFSGSAAKEAAKFGAVHIAADTSEAKHTFIPAQSDMSSDILPRSVDVSKYGLIYAGAQKNMAPAGLTVVIVKKDLAGHERKDTPLMLSYQRMIEKDSMFNTPPCWCIYILGLVLEWLEGQGGVKGMEQIKRERARKLYEFLDNSALFTPNAQPGSRSDMNVTFRTGDPALDALCVSGAAERGLLNIKGHRIAGGMRASIYNAMPMAGVDALIAYLKEFEVEHHGK